MGLGTSVASACAARFFLVALCSVWTVGFRQRGLFEAQIVRYRVPLRIACCVGCTQTAWDPHTRKQKHTPSRKWAHPIAVTQKHTHAMQRFLESLRSMTHCLVQSVSTCYSVWTIIPSKDLGRVVCVCMCVLAYMPGGSLHSEYSENPSKQQQTNSHS